MLYLLGTGGATRPSILAAQLRTGRSNVSKLLNRLEAEGLIESLADPRDSRAQLVSLTRAGVERSHEVFSIGDDMMRELTAEWSPEEVGGFTELLARLNTAAARYEERLRPGA